ncbi:helix-turn-helix domain-containing protein [Micromonospora globbae]|jgi:transcriptional regulator with XRE-family HTH domain|uniref:XRE family transcriptional regulator n=1 Tax=Micromonospora globbae TaxID=1894969 RepID=A0A420ET76_9ACTN|nr:helix-turn-helix transcriptional regulator [Micromonospora globbae]RKF23878.1 XRE family transcriptional regulator [Micromonospora globbae]
MELSARRQPPTVRLRRLAAELRGLRTAAGLTREEVNEQTGINPATLYRIETARVRPQRRTLMAMLDKYGVTDEDRRSELIALSRQAAQLGWLQAYESELPELYTTYISFEAEARSVRNYESLFVPGLLQTENYAHAVIRGVLPLATDLDVQARVDARMQRQESLRKTEPLRVWAILDEAVLHRQTGGAEVMAEQLEALARAADQPHVTLQVIPFTAGAHAGMPGSFVVMDFPDPADPALVYVDSMAGDLFLEREADVRRYATTFEHLRATALDPTNSIKLIKQRAAMIGQEGGTG